jgi:hypothetical protein
LYAIKVYFTKPKNHTSNEKNYYLMRDMEDSVVHVFTRRERAEKMAQLLQEENPRMHISVTENIPAPALSRALKKKSEDEKETTSKESNSEND